MTAIPISTIRNRPTGKPVFDFQIGDRYARVPLTTVSNDGQNLVVSAWACEIDAAGSPVLDTATGVPTGSADGTNTIVLSGVLVGTHTLYDGWCKYMPTSGQTVNAENLPAGWASGHGVPTGASSYGTHYYDLDAAQSYEYRQGELARVAQGHAEALAAQIDTAAKLSAIGL